MKLISGTNWELEDRAMEILKDDRAKFIAANHGTYSFRDINTWLTESQLDLRRTREVYPVSGEADKVFSGQFNRKYNPTARTSIKNQKRARTPLYEDDTCRDTGRAGISPRGFFSSQSGPFNGLS